MNGIDLGEHLLIATGLPVQLAGDRLKSWKGRLATIERAFLAAHDARRNRVSAAEYRRIATAAEELLAAIRPLADQTAPEPSVIFMDLDRQLPGVIHWAANKANALRVGGRPSIRVNDKAAEDLLVLFAIAYRRRPTHTLGGPAMRFVSAFFDRWRGEVFEDFDMREIGDEKCVPVIVSTRPIVMPPVEGVRDLVRKALVTVEPRLNAILGKRRPK